MEPNAAEMELQPQDGTLVETPLQEPFILMISLQHQTLFDHVYGPLLHDLTSKANLERLDDPCFVLMRLTPIFTQPQAVIIADEALTLPQYNQILQAVRQYLFRGGTVIVMGHFPGFVKPEAIGPFFRYLGNLPWEAGWYGRKKMTINRACAGPFGEADLLDEYETSAVFLRNVHINNTCYTISPTAAPDSDGPSFEMPDIPLTSVAWINIGEGQLGYVGDVRLEAGSKELLLVMCGIGVEYQGLEMGRQASRLAN